jgi:hypothetical protein
MSKETRRFKKGDLIIIPCCGSKRGTEGADENYSVMRMLSPGARKQLKKARRLAFARTRIDRNSPKITALTLYTGFLYKFPGLRAELGRLLAKGIYVLILSGGYGLVHPYERIHAYEAPISNTQGIWRKWLPGILKDFVKRNDIRRVFVFGSSIYVKVLDATKDQWAGNLDIRFAVKKGRAGRNRYQDIAHQMANELLHPNAGSE